ncbi:hypothetical protein J5N97_009857 [Dioscorea zingiberensis]|uniref:Transposase (putative) gypsy type domain-containing protein n=1 Tax=Dioscorea zingiberensis TaxID=325984 RepID=A0A9D5HN33_9LILI|nr:hypothetical protein J5N97_009857 [Dioscorea zingiberensis]
MPSATSSSSSSSHGSSIPSPSNPTVSVAILGEPRDIPIQGSRVHRASRAMARGSGTFISLLGQKDVDGLVERYEIDLSLFEIRVPCSGERTSSPREGEIAIYQDALSGGLRLPFSDFAKAILEEYRLCPSQLTPNSWRLLNGFVSFKKITDPMEDEDLSYVKGLLASYEGEVHPPLPRGRKKKEAASSKGVDTSKEEKKKRKRKEAEAGEAALLEKLRVADSVLRGPATQGKELLSEDIPFRDAASVKNVLMAMRLEQLSTKLLGAGREEATRQLFRSAMLTAHWADRVGILCQKDLAKIEASREEFAQLNSKVEDLEEKEKKQLAIIHTFEKDKAERLQQLAAIEKEKNDLAAKLESSEGSLQTAKEDIKRLQDDSSSLKKELKSAQDERTDAKWSLKLKVAELAAIQVKLEELKGERDTLKEDLASRQRTPKSDSQEMKDLIERADKLEKEVARLRAKAKEGATCIYSVVQHVGHHVPPADVLSMGLARVLKKFMELKELQLIKTLEAPAPAPSKPPIQVPPEVADRPEGPSS